MTGHTHSLRDWIEVLSLGVGVHAALSVPYFVLVDADLADFDPRPAARRALAVGEWAVGHVRSVVWDVTRSEALYPLLREWDNAPHNARRFLRDAGLTLPALLLLTTRPKGAMA